MSVNTLICTLFRKTTPQGLKAQVFPLDIPEILASIFCHLNQPQLFFGPSRVSRLWRSVSLTFIFKTASWRSDTPHTDEIISTIVWRLRWANKLNCQFQDPCSEQAMQNLERLISLDISDKDRNSIHSLDIVDFNINRIVFSLAIFENLNSLTTLNIRASSGWTIPMTQILSTFPNLTAFSLGLSEYHNSSQSLFAIENSEIRWPASSRKLQSLTLETMSFNMTALEDFLGSCTDLKELRLVDIHPMTPTFLDRNRIFAVIARLCPKVRSFHYSEPTYFLDSTDFRSIITEFPRLSAWGMKAKDFYRLHHWSLIFRTLIPYIFNLTTLELVSPCQSIPDLAYYRDIESHTRLHTILCSAPNLIHLRARDAFVLDTLLDIVGKKVNESSGIWACRNLKTLHVSIVNNYRETTFRAQEEYDQLSRSIFAFLVRSCPKLCDIHIQQSDLSLKLEGGLYLLSELQGLEKLTIMTNSSYYPIHSRDLYWISAIPHSQHSTLQRIRVKLLKAGQKRTESTGRNQRQQEGIDQSGDEPEEPVSELVDKIEKSSQLAEMPEILERLAGLSKKGELLWPELRQLQLCPNISKAQQKLDIEIRSKLRPQLIPSSSR